MSRGRTVLGAALAASLVAGSAGAVTSYRTSVNGITKGATVRIQGEAQCPQGQQCRPQITATLTVKTDSGEVTKSGSVSVEEGESAWGWHDDFIVDELPSGKTFMGNFEIQANVDVTFKNVKATVEK